MKLIIKMTLSLLCLFCFSVLKAQSEFKPGFVITQQNDTIKGLIDYSIASKNLNKCDFKEYGKPEIKEYFPAEIKGFRFNGSKFFVSREVVVNGEKVALFLEFLIDGNVDLYSFNNGTTPRFFIQKDDGEIRELFISKKRVKNEQSSLTTENFDYMSTLKTIMADSPRFFTAIGKTAFDTQSLIMLVKRYNNYISSSGSVFYEPQPPDVKVIFGSFVSYNISTMGMSSSPLFETIDFQNSGYPSIGVLANTYLLKSNRTFSLQASAELGQSKFYGTGIYTPYYTPIFEEVYYKTLNLKGKLGLKFTYPKGMIRPTLLAGGNIIYLLKKDGRRVTDNTQNTTIFIDEVNENFMPNYLFGYNVELGVDCHLSSKIIPFLSMGYTYSSGNNKSEKALQFVDKNAKELTTTIKTFYINAGIYF